MTFSRQADPVCGRCRQRNHTLCAQPCACPCEGAYRKVSNARIGDDDVRIAFGDRGYYGADDRDAPACEHPSRVCRHAPVMSDGWEYVWSARAGAYRYTSMRVTTRTLMREDNGRARSIARTRRTRTAQPTRPIAEWSVWNPPTIARDGARVSRVTALARGGYGL